MKQVLMRCVMSGCLIGLLVVWSGCTLQAESDEHEGHNHAAGEHDQAAGGKAVGEMTPEEIRERNCEHKVPAYQCTECGYESGVVKVPAEMIRENGGVVSMAQVETRSMTASIQFSGELSLDETRTAHLGARIPGIIRTVDVDLGDHVKAGQILMTIESVELGEAVSNFKRSHAERTLAERTLIRETALWEQKIAAEQDLLDAQIEFDKSELDVESARHRLSVLGLADHDIEALRNGKNGMSTGALSVRALMDGTVVFRHASVGEYVEPGEDLMIVSALDSLWIWLDAYEKDLKWIRAAAEQGSIPVIMSVNAYPGESFLGQIDLISDMMDKESRTVRLRGNIDNTSRKLNAGMFCRGDVANGEGSETTVVPSAAIMHDEGISFVFKHLEADLYYRCNVTVGRRTAEWVEIAEGVQVGESVIQAGAFLLKSDILRAKMGAGCAD